MKAIRVLTGILFAPLILPASTPAVAQTASFASNFADRTMRVDFYHTGDAGRETFARDRVVSDGPWAGSETRLLDSLNLGTYFFEVRDSATDQPLYSRGYSSIYAEWATTAEAGKAPGTFHESLRFPWPRRPVRVIVSRRDARNGWHALWTTIIDPDSPEVNSASLPPAGRLWTVFASGPPKQKVDIVLVSEGYTRAELPKFHADVRRLVAKLFATEPFKHRRSDFNVRALDLPSAASGINRPNVGHFRRTPLSTSYNIFGSERYVLTEDNRALRDALSNVPYEFVEILVNEKQYGGGGIFNDQSTVAVGTAFAEYIFVHEFGHHFAGLADEYYTSPVAYQADSAGPKVEPWEPNVTALRDPAALKWRDLVDSGVPIPTPWQKAEYETHSREIQARRKQLIDRHAPEAEFDALFREQLEAETPLLGSMTWSHRTGAFEGAAYEATGLYRPETDCIMFTRDAVGFCRVCRRAIERIMDQYAAP
ncbi:MAG: M64 family metallopeptidase [Gemmatimonadota bacterium]